MYFHEAWEVMMSGKEVFCTELKRRCRIMKERRVIGETVLHEAVDLEFYDDENKNWDYQLPAAHHCLRIFLSNDWHQL